MKKRALKKFDLTMLLTTLICLLPIVLSLFLYDSLPETVAVHFDGEGHPDGYAPRWVAAFALPMGMALLNLLVHFGLNTDPKRENSSKVVRNLGKWLIPVITVILVPVTLFMALGYDFPLEIFIPALLGIIFIVAGNYLPKSRQNYTVGIKLPWTLDSEENWNKTHRLAGYLWIAGGLLMVVSSFLRAAGTPLMLTAIGIMVIIPVVYSYLLYRRGI